MLNIGQENKTNYKFNRNEIVQMGEQNNWKKKEIICIINNLNYFNKKKLRSPEDLDYQPGKVELGPGYKLMQKEKKKRKNTIKKLLHEFKNNMKTTDVYRKKV